MPYLLKTGSSEGLSYEHFVVVKKINWEIRKKRKKKKTTEQYFVGFMKPESHQKTTV